MSVGYVGDAQKLGGLFAVNSPLVDLHRWVNQPHYAVWASPSMEHVCDKHQMRDRPFVLDALALNVPFPHLVENYIRVVHSLILGIEFG